MMSNYVITPNVLVPCGSTSLANFNDSLLAKSSFPLLTANINEFLFLMYGIIKSNIFLSMSLGYSPTGFLVIPGKSTNMRSTTVGLPYFNLIGTLLMSLFFPHMFSVD